MNIVLLAPFYGGSHKQWADGLKKHSTHNIYILSLSAKHWKWRMHGSSVTLARRFKEEKLNPDLIIASDMMDLSVFKSLTSVQTHNIPFVLYFHENQITYPWSEQDDDLHLSRNFHYGFINYTSALSADKILFNSLYHFESFFEELPKFLKMYPDHNEISNVEVIKKKSQVLSLGFDFSELSHLSPWVEPNKYATILWNHRWEYDKNPALFFKTLFKLKENGIRFQLIVLGERTNTYPKIFDEAKEMLKDEIIQFGYVASKEKYYQLLRESDILPVSSNQDFFGGSVVEAMACNVFPLLPNRLAYPEHIPKAYAHTFLYSDDVNFSKRLQRLIMDVSIIRKQNINQWVEQYDWKNIIKIYDRTLEASSSIS